MDYLLIYANSIVNHIKLPSVKQFLKSLKTSIHTLWCENVKTFIYMIKKLVSLRNVIKRW